MEKFISIAIGAVAGEGHVVQDRLSDLRVVCSKFSVLLYNLPHHDESERIVKVMNCICKCAEKLRGFDAKLLVSNSTCTFKFLLICFLFFIERMLKQLTMVYVTRRTARICRKGSCQRS